MDAKGAPATVDSLSHELPSSYQDQKEAGMLERPAPDWIKLGRHDWGALHHGLRDLRDIGAWSILCAAYLSGPGPLPAADEAIVDILGLEAPKWRTLRERLLRLRRIEVRDNLLFVPILDEKLAHAAAAAARGKDLSGKRWGRKDG